MTNIMEIARDFLRYGECKYDIQINLFGAYGCYEVTGYYQGESIAYSYGMNLDKHVRLVLDSLTRHKITRTLVDNTKRYTLKQLLLETPAQPLTEEEREWLNAPPVGKEIL